MHITHDSPRIVPDSPSVALDRGAIRDRLRSTPVLTSIVSSADALRAAPIHPFRDVERLALSSSARKVIGNGGRDRGVILHSAVIERDPRRQAPGSPPCCG